MNISRFWLAMLCALLVLAPSVVYAQASVPRFEPAACPSPIPVGKIVQCGHLVVPEEHARPDGPTIRLGVAIVKSQYPHPSPAPLLILNGGPGGQALVDLSRFLDLYGQLISDPTRDVIVFDQRGVGWSQPALDCPELAPSLLDLARGRTLTVEEQLAPYRACRDRWLKQGVNLAAYNTTESAADVNDLWRTLGYTEVNLYGISYGTLLAQTVMRDWPADIRSVILDSAYPLPISLFGDTAANLSDTIQRILAACAADLVCRAVYPDVETVYDDLIERLNRTPISLTASDPVTGDRFTFRFDGADFVRAVSQTAPRQVPGLIYDLRDGHYAAVLERKKDELETLHKYGVPPNRAMAYSVICSQSMYSATPEQFAAAAQYPESVWAERFRTQEVLPLPCEQWPARGHDPADQKPVVSNILTLVLAGEYDSTLSPAYLRTFAESLSRSFVFTVPNAGHGVLLSGGTCAHTVAQAFLHDPTHSPDTRCLTGSGTPTLDTRFVVRAAAWAAEQGALTS
jgi:pimeloyl-ACP methyl ester carboxylesterase